MLLVQSTALNYVEQFSTLPESGISTTITLLKEPGKFSLDIIDQVDFGSLCFLHGYCLSISFIFPTAISILVLDLCMTVVPLVAAAPDLEVQGKALLMGLLGSCCHSCRCQSQPSPRALVMLLGFYLHSHSQGWTLVMSNQCRKAALCSSGGLTLHCLSH